MESKILLEAMQECMKYSNYRGGDYIIKQFFRDIEVYSISEEDIRNILVDPARLASHIILAYESLRLAKEGDASMDWKCLHHKINHVDSFPFGDPRLHNNIGIKCPSRLVMEFMNAAKEKYLGKIQRSMRDQDKWDRAWEKQECNMYFEKLEILLNTPAHTIWLTYMTFVSNVWRNGFYDYIYEQLKHKSSVDISIGKTMVSVIDGIRFGITFSANKKIGKRVSRQSIGITFLKGELEDPSGYRGTVHTCYVDLPTALSLLYNAIEAWPKVKKDLGL